MKLDAFDFELPEDRIAQEAVEPRDRARLLVVREHGFDHRIFADLPDLLRPRDLLVVNDTRVVPARLHGEKSSGGRVELLLVERVERDAGAASGDARAERYRALWRASRAPRAGERGTFGHGLRATVDGRDGDAWIVELRVEGDADGAVDSAIARAGVLPLPPYIRRRPDDPRHARDRRRYQTVYARHEGAVAAPTAGLHFTPELMGRVAAMGVATVRLTLHVGVGTFAPVRVESIEDHRMHAERYVLPAATAEAIERCRERGGRVIAVGTTVVRTLEFATGPDGRVKPGTGWCDLFIRPGHAFRTVDAMITNFHLPRSTLLMLVSAFAGLERIREAYRVAIERGYRFYSYGDACWLERNSR